MLIGHIGASFSVGAVGPARRFRAVYRKEIGEELKQISAKVGAAIKLCNVAQMKETDIPLLKPAQYEAIRRNPITTSTSEEE
ncbi:MAG: hypothetical protein ACQEUH_15020 [Pseudomonadota bacterium]